jgi:hypothetical protein
MVSKYLKKELTDWTKVGAFVFLGGFLLWTFAHHQANKVTYQTIGLENIPSYQENIVVTAPNLPEIMFVADQPLPPLENVSLPEITFYDDGLPEILPPLTDVVYPPLEG